MNRKTKMSVLLVVIVMSVLMGAVSVFADAETTSAPGMGEFFGGIYDFIFRDSLDSVMEDMRDELKVRVKTGIIIVLFVIILSAAFIITFANIKVGEPDPDSDEDTEAELACEDEAEQDESDEE